MVLFAMPVPVAAGPPGLLVPLFALTPQLGEGMTRSALGDEAVGRRPRPRRPHELAPSELIPYEGCSDVTLPWAADHPSPDLTGFLRDPWPSPASVDLSTPQPEWLGIYVFTPHYHAVTAAIHIGPGRGLQYVLNSHP